jgi:predicted RNA-binding Zn ribbon-like protein
MDGHLALGLINTQGWYGKGPAMNDRLAGDGALERFAAYFGLAGLGAPSAADRRRVLALRALLRRAATALSDGGDMASTDVAELNRFLATPVFRTLDRDTMVLVPVRRDWRWACAEIAASFAELVTAGDPSRVKVCNNPECQWAFYDASKNRRRRWCFASQCGNVAKVRAYRERQRRAG